MSWKCPHPKNVARTAHAMMKKDPKSSIKILLDICQQLDARSNNFEQKEESSSSFSESEDN